MSAIETIADRLHQTILTCHPLLARLNIIGNVKSFSGGRTIIQELENPERYRPPGVLYYGGYSIIDPSNKKSYREFPQLTDDMEGVFTTAEYPIRQFAIAFEHADDIDPDSEGVAASIKNFSTSLAHSVTWHAGPNSIHSLDQFVPSQPTIGVVGGIDRHHHKFWRSLALTVDAGVGLGEAMGLAYDRLTVVDGKIYPPDLILMGKDDFEAYEKSIPEDERISPEYGEFKSLMFRKATIVLDETLGPSIDNYVIRAPRIYMLNTRYLHFRYYKGRNFTVLDPDRIMPNPSLVRLIGWAGNLTCSCMYAHGVLLRGR